MLGVFPPIPCYIEMPNIAKTTLLFLQLVLIRWPKLQAPVPDRFISDTDAAFGQEVRRLQDVQAESIKEPDGLTADCRKETIVLVADKFGFHAGQSAKLEPR